MINLAQAGYSHEQVLSMLESHRIVDFRYELMDNLERKIGDLDQVSGTIRFDSNQEIMGTASFKIREHDRLNWNMVDERIRPIFRIKTPENTWLEYPLGMYIISSPTRKNEDGIIYRECECYDCSIILREDRITNRLLLAAGSNYVQEAVKIINSANISKVLITASPLPLPVDREFDLGESKLTIVNSLLQAINYTPIHFNNEGYAISTPYIEPAGRITEYSYQTNQNSIIVSGAEQGLDVFEVANIFVRYTETPEQQELISIYTNDKPGNLLSTVSRNRKIVSVEQVDDVADQATLDALTKRAAVETNQIYESLYITTALMPHHDYKNCIFVSNSELNSASRYIEQAWEMQLQIGGGMIHELKKVVSV